MKTTECEFENCSGQEAVKKLYSVVQEAGESANQLISALKVSKNVLEHVGQDEEEAKDALEPFARLLLEKRIIGNASEDVRLYAAGCFGELLSVYAPDPDSEDDSGPFLDKDHKEILRLIISVLQRLAKHNDKKFQVCHALLEVMRRVKFYLLPIDLECPNLISEMLKMFFKVVNEKTIAMLEASVLEIIQSILENAPEIPSEWVEVLVMPQLQSDNTNPTKRISRTLLSQCSDVLKLPISKYLAGALSNHLSKKAARVAWCQNLAYKLGEICPQSIDALVSHLDEQLQDSDGAVRLKAVTVLGKLLSDSEAPALPDAGRIHLTRLYAAKRFVDVKVDVRSVALTYFPQMVCNCGNLSLQAEMVKSACRGLHDHDEKIRSLAASGICIIAGRNPEAIHADVLKSALLRLRDKKPNVRKVVAKEVTGMVRKLLAKNNTGSYTNMIGAAFGALVEVCGDRNCLQAVHTVCNMEGLMPMNLCGKDCALAWIHLFQELSDKQAMLFFRVLRGKAAMQASIVALLSMITATGLDPPPDQEVLIPHMRKVSRLCPDQKKAMDNLEMLIQIKDRNVFSTLEQHFECQEVLHDGKDGFTPMLSKSGIKGALAEFLKLLSAMARPTLINPSHLCSLILEVCLKDEDCEQADRECGLILLKDVAKRASFLYACLPNSILQGLEFGLPDLQSSLLYATAKSGEEIRSWCERHVENTHFLKQLKQEINDILSLRSLENVKYAIHSLNSLLSRQEAHEELEKLLGLSMSQIKDEDFIDDPEAPLVFQILSSIGQSQPGLFSKHAEEFAHFLLHTFLPASLPASGDPCSVHGSSCSPDVSLKCAALKAFSKGCVPKGYNGSHKGTEAATVIFFAFAVEHRLLDFQQDQSLFGIHSQDDSVAFRLSATFAVLHMCRNPVLEGKLPNKLYTDVAMTVQDTDMLVREQVALQLRKQLALCYEMKDAASHRAARYAACMALSGIDPIAERRTFARETLVEFVSHQNRLVAESSEGADEKKLACKRPEFLIPYLVYLMLHHEDVVDALTILARQDSDEASAQEAKLLADVQQILFLGLEPILLSPELPDGLFSSYSTIRGTLEKVLLTEDAQEEGTAPRVRAVCDMALSVLDGTMAANSMEVSSSGPRVHPAVPSRLFKKARGPQPVEGVNLPKHFALITIKPAILKRKKRTVRDRQNSKQGAKDPVPKPAAKQGRKRSLETNISEESSPMLENNAGGEIRGEESDVTCASEGQSGPDNESGQPEGGIEDIEIGEQQLKSPGGHSDIIAHKSGERLGKRLRQ